MITFFKKHLWVFVLILTLVLLPQAINIQSELNMRIIITGMGVDLTDDGEYEVFAQVVRPTAGSTGAGSNASIDIVSAKGKNLSDGIYKVSYLLGKTAGLGHINCIVIGKKLAESENVLSSLDYFIRDGRVPNSALVLIAENTAKETLNKTKNLDLSTAVGLQKLFLYKQESLNGTMMQIESFMNNFYNPSKSGLISEISFEEEPKEEQSSSSGGSGGESSGGLLSSGSESSGSSQGGGQNSARIKYNNSLYMFKNGYKTGKIEDEKSLIGVNLLNPSSKGGYIQIDGVSDNIFKDASLGIYMRDKKVKWKVEFDENGNPICKVKIKTKRNEVVEILTEDEQNKDKYLTQNLYLTDSVVNTLKSKIEECIISAFEEGKNVQTDIFNLGTRLYRSSPKKWRNFLNSLPEGQDYITKLNLQVEVEIDKDF